jgi:hypothetical protein
MYAKSNVLASSQAKVSMSEDKVGCWRLWAKPKTPRKWGPRQSHIVLGPYPESQKSRSPSL